MIEVYFVRVEDNRTVTEVEVATKLQERRTALLAAAVTGKIDVRTVTTPEVS